MPRSFDLSADYRGSVEQVLAAFADERYWLARLADSGATKATLDALSVGADGGITVATTQVLGADLLPGLVKQLHRGELAIQRRETWSPVQAGRATARMEARIPGAPVTADGDAVLRPQDADARMELTIEVDVRVPLLGSKVEQFIGGQLTALADTERAFTSAWIAQQR